jgi:hypothetical protein
MKRTPLTRKTPMKPGDSTMRRSPLRKKSKSPRAKQKVRIQALVRQRAIERDGGCILRHYPEAGRCSQVLQGEHLKSRTHSRSYGDMRNIVCLCSTHHIFFKKQQPALYWDLIQRHVGPARWAWLQAELRDKSPHKVDWDAVEESLRKLAS